MSIPSLTDEDRSALAEVLDQLIPPSPDGRFPGAGEVGLVDVLEDFLGEQKPMIEAGLAALRELAAARDGVGFAQLSPEARQDVLNELGASQPAFVPGLLFHTYVHYYQQDRVLEALGMDARPPYPKGYELEAGDLSALEAVRQRGKLYRDAD